MREPSRLREDIRAYLEAENEWTRQNLESVTAGLQNELFDEMKGRIKEDDSSVPAIDGEWAYYRRFRDGGEYPLLCRRRSGVAFETSPDDEHLLLDGDELGAGLSHFDMRKAAHSPDHRFVAYAVDDKGSEFYTLRIRDLQRDGISTRPYRIRTANSFGAPIPLRCSGFRGMRTHVPLRCIRRKLGAGADELVYRETDPGFFVGVQQSQSRHYIFITANDHTTTEWRYFRFGCTSTRSRSDRRTRARRRIWRGGLRRPVLDPHQRQRRR